MSQKVLIVEDEAWIAEELQDTLTEHGYTVTDMVDSYELALLSLRKNQPDLVILDIRLKGAGTGVDIAHEINDRYNIPFLFLSSHIGPDTMNDILDESPHSILTKPCKPADLIASVQLALTKGVIEVKSNAEEPAQNSFFVKSEHAYQKINIDRLLYIKGEGSYTKVQLENERLVLRATLKDFDFLEDYPKLLRVHRSYWINMDKVDKIHSKFVEIGEYEIPLSKEGREELLQRINTVR